MLLPRSHPMALQENERVDTADQRKKPRVTPLRLTGVLLSALVLAIIVFCAIFQWDWLRGPIARFASAQIHRRVRIDGHLRVHLLTWTPTATIGGLKIAQPAWAGTGDMARIDSVKVAISLPKLLGGHVFLPLLDVEDPVLDLIQDGRNRANWDFSDGKKTTGKAAKLPPIQQFIIAGGDLHVVSVPRKVVLTGTVNAREAQGGGGGFHLAGRGTINRRPFLMNVLGGPLINIRADRPYPFDADVRAGDTHLTAKGSITRPFNFASVQARASITGSDLSDLYYLTGVTLPNSPPYAISADVARRETRYDIDRLVGRVGSSDLEGNLRVEMEGGRPDVTGALRSRVLNFKDLGALFGAGSRASNASAQQKAAAQALAAQDRLLPDATLDLQKVRNMEAKVDYRAASILAPNLPLRGVHLGVTLDHGRLDLNPITLTFPQGQLNGTAVIDASRAVQRNSVDLRLSGVRLQDFLKPKGGKPGLAPLTGVLQARAQLSGTGNSVHKAASTASGHVTAVIPRGQMSATFAELAGVNAVKGLGLLLSKSQAQTDVRCALVDFRASNGLLTASSAVLDTDPTLVTGGGTVNLADESLALKLQGKPKHFQLIHLNVPVTITGRLRKPAVGVQTGQVIQQAGIAAAVGVFLSPLAVILPFIDGGLAKNADCAAVYTEARSQGAPIKPGSGTKTPARTTTTVQQHAVRAHG